MAYKLGKLPPKFNPKTLFFGKYALASAPPPPPEKTYWEYLVKSYPMMRNDEVGDCTCACIGHMIQVWTKHVAKEVIPSDSDVIGVYSAITGFDPATGANDNGAYITDVLAYMASTGMAGHKIDGWAEISHTDLNAIKQGVWLFAGVDIGFNVPQSAMDQFQAKETWDVAADDGGIVGGHSVPIVGYGSLGCTCVTWGALQKMTWAFFSKYCDEAYGIVTHDWISEISGFAPNHIDLAALEDDLKELKA